MAEYIAPGYIKQYEEKSKVLSISDIQDIYITKFRTYVNDKIGDIDKIECKITDIKAVSNVEDLKQTFADNGVKGVSQYRSVDAEWIVTGKAGEVITLQVQEFVLKCDDGWYVDYVLLPAAVDRGSESGADDTDTSSESGVGDPDCTEVNWRMNQVMQMRLRQRPSLRMAIWARSGCFGRAYGE